jgi:hypothetical protein
MQVNLDREIPVKRRLEAHFMSFAHFEIYISPKVLTFTRESSLNIDKNRSTYCAVHDLLAVSVNLVSLKPKGKCYELPFLFPGVDHPCTSAMKDSV